MNEENDHMLSREAQILNNLNEVRSEIDSNWIYESINDAINLINELLEYKFKYEGLTK